MNLGAPSEAELAEHFSSLKVGFPKTHDPPLISPEDSPLPIPTKDLDVITPSRNYYVIHVCPPGKLPIIPHERFPEGMLYSKFTALRL